VCCSVRDNKVQRLVDRKGVLKLWFLSRYWCLVFLERQGEEQVCLRGDHQGDDYSGDLEKLRDFIHKFFLANCLHLKKKLYTFNMHPDKSQHIDEFHKLVGDLAAIDTAISHEEANYLYLKKKLYTFNMHPDKSQHIDEFHKLVGDLAAIDTAISDEDQALFLITSLPSSDDSFVETLLYDRDTLKLEDVLTTLNSRELQKMTEAEVMVVKGCM
nr:retrovirus-related Pol polyprotein from transposon TNT 1-94 [Tanacetum cinerariifolium]